MATIKLFSPKFNYNYWIIFFLSVELMFQQTNDPIYNNTYDWVFTKLRLLNLSISEVSVSTNRTKGEGLGNKCYGC